MRRFFIFSACDYKEAEKDDEGAYSLSKVYSFSEKVIVGDDDKNYGDRCDKHRNSCRAFSKVGYFQKSVIDKNEKEARHKRKAGSHNEVPIKNHFDNPGERKVSANKCA